jgi:alpha-glucosidase
MNKTTMLVAALAAMAMGVSADTLEIKSLPGEKWWGGATIFGRSQPYGDFEERDQNLENFNNQTAPFFVSSAGRYVWSEKPVKFSSKDGDLTLASTAKIELTEAGKTLREAFLAAAKKHFPPTGTPPPDIFFTRPQYNHAIESHVTGRNQASVERYACAIAGNGYPMGIVIVDDYWMKDFGVWEFDPGAFPDPKGMVERLHALGAPVMLWVVPYVSADSLEGLDLYNKHWVLERPNPSKYEYAAIVKWWSGYSFAYDFSVPDAKKHFVDVLKGLQRDYGVDGYKFDGADLWHYTLASPTGFKFRKEGYTAADNCREFSLIASEFPFNELRASYKTAGLPLVQRLQDKAHSWEALDQIIPDMLAAGILGYAYTCADMIGGGLFGDFLEKKFLIDHKIFVRSCQAHALMPMMQFSIAPWRVLNEEEVAICRDAAELHVAFAPYIISLAQHSAKTGAPIVRLMEYEFPHQGLEMCRDQFMLGSEWLVAPVIREDDSRTVRLPKGEWKDDLGETHVGPKTLELLNVPLARLPRFKKL